MIRSRKTMRSQPPLQQRQRHSRNAALVSATSEAQAPAHAQRTPVSKHISTRRIASTDSPIWSRTMLLTLLLLLLASCCGAWPLESSVLSGPLAAGDGPSSAFSLASSPKHFKSASAPSRSPAFPGRALLQTTDVPTEEARQLSYGVGVCLTSNVSSDPAMFDGLSLRAALMNRDPHSNSGSLVDLFNHLQTTYSQLNISIDILDYDCGNTAQEATDAMARMLTDVQSRANFSILCVLGGSNDETAMAIRDALYNWPIAIVPPFMALRTTIPDFTCVGPPDSDKCWYVTGHQYVSQPLFFKWNPMLRLSVNDYAMAQSFFDFYSTVLQSQETRPWNLNSQCQIVVVGSDDTSSKSAVEAVRGITHRLQLIDVTNIMDPLNSDPAMPLALNDLNDAIQTAFRRNGKVVVWLLTVPKWLTVAVMRWASSRGLLQQAVWMLSTAALSGLLSDPTVTGSLLQNLTDTGVLAVRAGSGLLVSSEPYSRYSLSTNTAGCAEAVRTGVVDPLSCYDHDTKNALDFVSILKLVLEPMFSQSDKERVDSVNKPKPLVLPDYASMYIALLSVSTLGLSGPISFSPNGDRKAPRLAYAQMRTTTNGTLRGDTIGHWNPLTGVDLDIVTGTPALKPGGHGSLLPDPNTLANRRLTPSIVTTSLTWATIPATGAPPPARYGACVVMSTLRNVVVVLGGTASVESAPYDDLWIFSLAAQSWEQQFQSGVRPPPAYYAGCAIDPATDIITVFGGFTGNGLSGELWHYSLGSNVWRQETLSVDLSYRAPRAQFGRTTMNVEGDQVLLAYGGVHQSTRLDEVWTFNLTDGADTTDRVGAHSITLYADPSAPAAGASGSGGRSGTGGSSAPLGYDDSLAPPMARAAGYVVVVLSDAALLFLDVDNGVSFHRNVTGAPPGGRTTAELQVYEQLLEDGTTADVIYMLQGALQDPAAPNANDIWSMDVTRCYEGFDGKPWNSSTCVWQSRGAMPGPGREGLSTVRIGPDMLAFGGRSEVAAYNDLLLVRGPPAADLTSPLTQGRIHDGWQAPASRAKHAVAVVGNRMVIHGGIGASGTALSDTWIFDFDRQMWQPMGVAALPQARFGHVGGSLRMHMLVYGGSNEEGVQFDDLWSRSFAVDGDTTSTWKSLDYSSSVQYAPGARSHALSWTSGDKYWFITGGSGLDNTRMSDVSRWDTDSAQWTLVARRNSSSSLSTSAPTFSVAPDDMIEAAGAWDEANKVFWMQGGRDSYYQPSRALWLFNISSNSWLRLTDMGSHDDGDAPLRYGHNAVMLGGKLLVYGGVDNNRVVLDDLWIFDPSSNSPWKLLQASRLSQTAPPSSHLTYSQSLRRPLAGFSMVSYGLSVTVFGGSSAEINSVHAPGFVLQELRQFTLYPICLVGNPDSVLCTDCMPGTKQIGFECRSCPKGTYWTAEHGDCVACAAGRFGAVAGATSDAACIPCGNGSFSSTPGSSVCQQCGAGSACPIGSTSPNSTTTPVTTVVSHQPVPHTSRDFEVQQATDTLNWVMLAVVLALVLVYLLQLYGVLPLYSEMWRLDRLFSGQHSQADNKPMVSRQTSMGGYCTILSAFAVIYIGITVLLPFAMDNVTEIRSLVPNAAIAPSTTFSANFSIMVTINGGGDGFRCVSDQGAGLAGSGGDSQVAAFCQSAGMFECDPNIPMASVKSSDSSHTSSMPQQCCRSAATNQTAGAAASCTVRWTCVGCQLYSTSFSFLSADSYATTLAWQMSASAGYPDQSSQLQSELAAGNDNYFRGPLPSLVSIRATPTLYTESRTQLTVTGFLLNFDSQQRGSLVAPADFHSTNGVFLTLQLTEELTTLTIEHSEKLTRGQFVSLLLGAVTGILGTVALLMDKAESAESLGFSKSKRWAHLSAEHQLQVMLADYEKTIVDKARAAEKLADKHSGLPAGGKDSLEVAAVAAPAVAAASGCSVDSAVVSVEPASDFAVDLNYSAPAPRPSVAYLASRLRAPSTMPLPPVSEVPHPRDRAASVVVGSLVMSPLFHDEVLARSLAAQRPAATSIEMQNAEPRWIEDARDAEQQPESTPHAQQEQRTRLNTFVASDSAGTGAAASANGNRA